MEDDDDIDYGELFGVTLDSGGAEPAGEPAAQEAQPAQEEIPGAGTAAETPEGGQEQQPAQEQASDPGAASQELEQVPVQRAESGQGQQDQERARYEAAAAKAREDAQRAIDAAFAQMGLKNPYTGQPITSKAEYDAYKERFDAERREQVLKKTGMSGEEFQQFVQDLPEVRKAREAQEAAEKAQREARESAARVKVEEQVREIGAMDPSIKSLEDLAKMPTYPRFYELVKRGNTLTDAFRLANFDALVQRSAAGVRQAAVNSVRSKEHLEQTRPRGTGAVSVPAEVREQYKLFNPDATEEEIQKHYQKNHKEG